MKDFIFSENRNNIFESNTLKAFFRQSSRISNFRVWSATFVIASQRLLIYIKNSFTGCLNSWNGNDKHCCASFSVPKLFSLCWNILSAFPMHVCRFCFRNPNSLKETVSLFLFLTIHQLGPSTVFWSIVSRWLGEYWNLA